MIRCETRRGEHQPPSERRQDADRPASRKNDEVPESRQDPDRERSDDDDQIPHGDRRGS
jgi:hypothetical protein